MRSAHTVEQIRAAEAAHPDLASGALMQRAAYGLATAVVDYLGGAYGRRIVLLIGSGDNGGDALYAGAVLARRGARVEAWLLADRAHPGGLAALRGAGGTLSEPRPLRAGAVDAVIDGIVGIGGRPGLPARVAEAVIPINRSIPFIAVDLPSGVDADTGELDGMALRADLTVTFGTHRIAHLADPAAEQCGVVELVDLGLSLPAAAVEALQPADVAALVRRPASAAQKYTRGVVGIRAGSATYPGAALLAVAGANTGIAGMVRYVGSAAALVTAAHPEVVGSGRVQAWVVGPGGGDEAAEHLTAALADDVPVVVDADALSALRALIDGGALSRPATLVLTPHAGELAALLDVERREVEARPLHHARTAADRFGAVVLLKGRRTVIAAPEGRTRVNTTGTPWLATAGAGDVLAGLIGSLLAAGLTPFDAASAGAWIHGAAATGASRSGAVGGGLGHGHPLIARAVAAAIPAVVGDWEP
ncbi:NAD(P)H-hydrate dehydratase [Nocardioides sp.]|uniref:NAD(P)H-hydrate dehydratase n=1 Tax=Nocardioides sp. TaxID=35761 RepID=UPI002611F9B7|nr:NAD(P)H-hydrate dehydratase [Nocardioides sp.]